MNSKVFFESLEFSIRLFTGYFVFIYGALKPWQFQGAFESNNVPVNELEGMALMWSFFGYSKTVPIVIGIFECVGSILLVFNRSKLFGAVILLPVLSNIVLYDLIYGVSPIATSNAIFFLGGTLFVLTREYKKVLSALKKLVVDRSPNKMVTKIFTLRLPLLAFLLFLNWVVLNFLHWISGGATCLVWLVPIVQDIFDRFFG